MPAYLGVLHNCPQTPGTRTACQDTWCLPKQAFTAWPYLDSRTGGKLQKENTSWKPQTQTTHSSSRHCKPRPSLSRTHTAQEIKKLEMSLCNSLLANKLNALTGYHKEKENVPVLLLMHNNVVLTPPFKSTRSPFHETLLASASGGSYNPGKFQTAFSLK